MAREKWRLVNDYDLEEYACGLRAGDCVRLKQDLIIRDHKGKPTGDVYSKGTVDTVLPGSSQDPGIVWLRAPNGERHTWDDDPCIFEMYERVDESD